MKTNYHSSKRFSIYTLFGILAITISSCSSYQNSSYYDDGIYGSSQHQQKMNSTNSQSNKYQQYFSDLNKDAEVFTNIDNYSSTANDSLAKSNENYNANNSSWGNNPQSVTVNVYDNNWGYNYWNNYWYGSYWGWNNWYGPSFGWGWNSWYGPSWSLGWGFGWNNWYGPGWYGGYWGNYCNDYYYHNGGRRGDLYGNYGNYGNRFGGARSGNIRNTSSYSGIRGNNLTTPSRTNNFGNPRNNFNNIRSNNNSSPVRNNSNSAPSQNYTPTPTQPRGNVRSESYTPSRSYTPSSNYGGRSSSGGGFSGGRSSGGRR